jgi:hypothetical protein
MTSFGPSPPVSSYPGISEGAGGRGRDGTGGSAGGGGGHTVPRPLNYGYGASSVPVHYSSRSGSVPRSSPSTSSNGRTTMAPPISSGMPMKGRSIPGLSNDTFPSSGGVAHYPTASRVPVNVQPHQSTSAAPLKGTLKPGQEVVVGAQKVVVDRYLSEGELSVLSSRSSRVYLTTTCPHFRWLRTRLPDPLSSTYRSQPAYHTLSEADCLST